MAKFGIHVTLELAIISLSSFALSVLLSIFPAGFALAIEELEGKDEEAEPTESGVPGPYEEDALEFVELDELDVTWDEVDDDEEAERGPCP